MQFTFCILGFFTTSLPRVFFVLFFIIHLQQLITLQPKISVLFISYFPTKILKTMAYNIWWQLNVYVEWEVEYSYTVLRISGCRLYSLANTNGTIPWGSAACTNRKGWKIDLLLEKLSAIKWNKVSLRHAQDMLSQWSTIKLIIISLCRAITFLRPTMQPLPRRNPCFWVFQFEALANMSLPWCL